MTVAPILSEPRTVAALSPNLSPSDPVACPNRSRPDPVGAAMLMYACALLMYACAMQSNKYK